MKLETIVEDKNVGTYVGMRMSEEASDKIEQFIGSNQIPNGLPRDKLHTTVVYSRKHLPDFTPHGRLSQPAVGIPKQFNVWDTVSEDNPSKCLVLEYESEEQVTRHNGIRQEHGATHDFPDYTPHMTLSYDIGDDFDVDSLDPSDIGDIDWVEEYVEDLELDWAEKNS